MYAIVRFIDEGYAPGIVCTHWINKDQKACYYPNVKTNELKNKLLKRLAEPEEDWSSCRIKILQKYSSFRKANLSLSRMEDSDSESEDKTIINRPRKRKRICSSCPEEESEEECPHSPSSKSNKKTTNEYMDPNPLSPRDNSNLQPPSSQIQPQIASPPYSIFGNGSDVQVSTSMSTVSDPTTFNEKLEAWMSETSLKLKQIEDKMDLVLKHQEKLVSQPPRHSETNETPGYFATFENLPAQDDTSFMELNAKLVEDSHFRDSLIKVLISLGGRDMRSHIHHMLRRVLTDEVAEMYSLSGKGTLNNSTKKPFFSTEVSKLIIFAAQRVFKGVATEVKIKESVGAWLHQAKVRKDRRMQRQEKKSEEENTVSIVFLKDEIDDL